MAKSIMCPGKNYLLVKVKEGREYKSLVLVCLLGPKGSLNDLNYIGFENLVEKDNNLKLYTDKKSDKGASLGKLQSLLAVEVQDITQSQGLAPKVIEDRVYTFTEIGRFLYQQGILSSPEGQGRLL